MGTTAVHLTTHVVAIAVVLLVTPVACTSQINAVPWDTFFVAPTVVLQVSSVVGTAAVHLVTCVVASWVIGAALLET